MEIAVSIARGLLGVTFCLMVAFLFSRNRKAINWRLVILGLGLQGTLALLLLTDIPAVRWFFEGIAGGFLAIISFAEYGSSFVFGSLGTTGGGESGVGFIFAFQVLPIIIFFSALTSALYYLGILQYVVKGFAWVMGKTMRVGGAESISAAANVFLGQTEAPLLVKPYIAGMSRSELLCLMVGGMATLAGSVMAAYIKMLGGTPEVALNLLSASLMNAPAAIVCAKILLPETERDYSTLDLSVNQEKIGANFLDAIANGTSEGLMLALNVGAMLIAFVALIFMVNGLFEWIGTINFGGDSINMMIKNSTMVSVTDINGATSMALDATGNPISAFDKLSVEYLVGQVFRFVAFALGVEWKDTLLIGSFLGVKVILNEFIAYSNLAKLQPGVIAEKSKVIASFALCGFANFASIAIQIGGIGGLAPTQRVNLSKLGLLAVLGGMLASFMSAAIAGMFY